MRKIIIAAALCVSSILGMAEDTIAVVDMDRLFGEYNKTKIVDANLKKQVEIFKKYAEELNESLVKLQQEFRDLRDASQNIAVSDVERENKRLSAQDKARQIKEKEAELKSYSIEKQDQLKAKYAEMRTSLLEEIKAVIERKAVEKGYLAVFDTSGKTLNDMSSVIFNKKEIDITEAILEEINGSEKKAEPEKPDQKDKYPNP
jgi:Skp family chaperone for outer membrane proteins